MTAMASQLLRSTFSRVGPTCGMKSWTGGVEYDQIKYYPRHPDHKDPPYEPSKLLMVQRMKPFKFNAWFLKKILVQFKLDGKIGEPVIVKNTAVNCALLYKIKHLIRVTPIRTPDGVPESADDLTGGYLNEDGVFTFSKKLVANEERIAKTKEFQTEPSRLDADTLIKQSRNRWDMGWW